MPAMTSPSFELFLRLSTALFLGTALSISASYRRRADRRGGHLRSEGARLLVGIRLLGLVFLLPMLLWFFWPDAVRWAQWAVPPPLRIAGLVLQLVALPALVWVLHSIGDNISPTQATREGHELVTAGPYRFIRHPLYTFGTVFFVGMALASALWTWALGLLPLWAMLLWRTPREEANLRAQFGPAYSDYQARTGRYLPRLRPAR
jgi:protein-S-isoprenylcysteine O-methyltransferase Ste14